jgi:predicted small lipoprotein YifL
MKYRLALGLVVGALAGCGIQGPPVPPEDVGVAGRIQREREKELKAKEEAKQRGEEVQRAQEAETGVEAGTEISPLEGAVPPSARPSGDVPVKPR